MSVGAKVVAMIREAFEGFLADPESAAAMSKAAAARIGAKQLKDLDALLSDSRISYRDGIVIQLAYGLAADDEIDLTLRHPGARTVAQQLGQFFADSHIQNVKDAYQNIAKNTKDLARGNVAEFDRFLKWASQANEEERSDCFSYVCAEIAATARPVLPMPELNRSRLTYAAVSRLIGALFSTNSQGAFEQFAVAAFLHAVVSEYRPGVHRVETKSLNATDKSSFVAGDVQIVLGNRVIEAYEVTANHWKSKLAGAVKTIRDNDLARLHIVATVHEGERPAESEDLIGLTEDVSVIGVQGFVDSLIGALTKPGRAQALVRLYEYLDRYQPYVERVNQYVEELRKQSLVEELP